MTQSSRDIETAIGILVDQRHSTAGDAFALMSTVSQHTHRTLRDVAADIICTGELPSAPVPGRRKLPGA